MMLVCDMPKAAPNLREELNSFMASRIMVFLCFYGGVQVEIKDFDRLAVVKTCWFIFTENTMSSAVMTGFRAILIARSMMLLSSRTLPG